MSSLLMATHFIIDIWMFIWYISK